MYAEVASNEGKSLTLICCREKASPCSPKPQFIVRDDVCNITAWRQFVGQYAAQTSRDFQPGSQTDDGLFSEV